MNKKEIIVSNKLTIRANIVSTHAITLITLVITIVLLIILAGITINISLGNKGIFTQAKQAKKDMERATTIEQIQIEIYDKQLEEEGTSINKQDLENILSKYGEVKKDAEGNITGIKPEGKEEIAIQDIIGNNKITEKDKIKPGESGYEGGAYNDPYIPKGFTHIGEDDWNHGYTIIGKTISVGNEFVWVPCVLTEEEQQAAQNNGDEIQIFQKTLSYPKNNSISITGDTAEADNIKKSVGKYQGFYIAKYEAGIPETTISAVSNHNTSVVGDILPVSKPNVGVWNFISRADAILLSNKMISYEQTGVHSTLISGESWDTTLRWITDTIDDTYAINSTNKGNYSGIIAVTSSNLNTEYSKNNIYDMAGNAYEWTTENCLNGGNSDFVGRGRELWCKWL